MKIGVFDSGLGGLFILKALVKKLPQYDYLYLGDTKHLPYGSKSQAQIYKLTTKAVDYLFKNNCQLIVLACNTASARALRKIQQVYLPKHYPGRKVLGVIIPTAEIAAKFNRIGIIATQSTVNSKTFVKELKKINSKASIKQVPAPLLVPLIESGQMNLISKVLPGYLKPLKNSQALILGCTHYPIIKHLIKKEVGSKVKIISQTEILPQKLEAYLKRHPEITKTISKSGKIDFQITKITLKLQAKKWFGGKINIKKVSY